MIMKNAIWIPFTLLILCLSGCTGDKQEASSSSTSTSGKPRIALIMKSLANEFFSTMADGAKQHMESFPEYELVVNGIKDERDLSRQAALVDEMVASGAKAIVIAPADSKALIPALRKAKKAGVAVINIDNRLDEGVLAQEKLVIPFVGPDNRLGAKKVGAHLAQKLNKGDQVAILEGITTSFNSQQRKLGFEEAMKEAGMEIVSIQSAQWEMNQANTISASILSEYPKLRAILAANDSMALGAMAAIKSVNKTDQVLVVGFDNISAAQQAVQEGKMLATADQHGDKLAIFGIDYAMQLIQSPDHNTLDVETPVDLITTK
jgi:ribose transport system substrate-binding protein